MEYFHHLPDKKKKKKKRGRNRQAQGEFDKRAGAMTCSSVRRRASGGADAPPPRALLVPRTSPTGFMHLVRNKKKKTDLSSQQKNKDLVQFTSPLSRGTSSLVGGRRCAASCLNRRRLLTQHSFCQPRAPVFLIVRPCYSVLF